MSSHQGFFTVFEGIDGVGKSTQARLLADHLLGAGVAVMTVKEPGGTALGDQLRELLLSRTSRLEPLTELLLYEASRCQLVREVIGPAMARGQMVISERYALSSLAYQGYGRGLSLDLIKDLNAEATGGLEPDLTFWIDLSPQIAWARLKKLDRIEGAGLAFYERVHRGYQALAKENDKIVRLNGEETPAELARQVASRVDTLIYHHVGP
jgi:dTMP kinase